MTRLDTFGLELERQHIQSPGVVADDEIICRGGYDPMHYNKGKPKNSIVRADELLEGSLSVWRGGNGGKSDFLAALEQIQSRAPNDQTLRSVFAPTAAEIRDIALQAAERVFYVIDDCATDENGGFHPLHCGVKMCPSLGISTKEDDLFIQAKNQLLRVLKGSERQVQLA